MKKINAHKADTRFTRNDFNMLYDYLWRDLHTSDYHAINGKNKESRAEAKAEHKAIKKVIEYMEIIENQDLYFENGEIFKAE